MKPSLTWPRPAKLSAYRARENIPLGWFVGTGTQQNIVLFLDSKLRIAKWIYGTDYSDGDVDGALKNAAGDRIGLVPAFRVAVHAAAPTYVFALAEKVANPQGSPLQRSVLSGKTLTGAVLRQKEET